jgi:hypothetical protein
VSEGIHAAALLPGLALAVEWDLPLGTTWSLTAGPFVGWRARELHLEVAPLGRVQTMARWSAGISLGPTLRF